MPCQWSVAGDHPSGIAVSSRMATPVPAAAIHARPPRALRSAIAYGVAQSARATKPPVISRRVCAPTAANSLIASSLAE